MYIHFPYAFCENEPLPAQCSKFMTESNKKKDEIKIFGACNHLCLKVWYFVFEQILVNHFIKVNFLVFVEQVAFLHLIATLLEKHTIVIQYGVYFFMIFFSRLDLGLKKKKYFAPSIIWEHCALPGEDI